MLKTVKLGPETRKRSFWSPCATTSTIVKMETSERVDESARQFCFPQNASRGKGDVRPRYHLSSKFIVLKQSPSLFIWDWSLPRQGSLTSLVPPVGVCKLKLLEGWIFGFDARVSIVLHVPAWCLPCKVPLYLVLTNGASFAVCSTRF